MLAFAAAPVALADRSAPSEADLRHSARFTRTARRAQSIAARALARHLLEGARSIPGARWQLGKDDLGRLWASADTYKLSVSLAHSRSMVAAAIAAPGIVGIDIEFHDATRRWDALAAAAFGPEERAAAAEGPASFYRLWTAREALAKASGGGFGLVIDGMDHVQTTPPRQFRYTTEIDGYVLTVVGAEVVAAGDIRLDRACLGETAIWRWTSTTAA
jgi:phosphopantetheinyl transferase